MRDEYFVTEDYRSVSVQTGNLVNKKGERVDSELVCSLDQRRIGITMMQSRTRVGDCATDNVPLMMTLTTA